MDKVKYTTRSGAVQYRPVMSEADYAQESEDGGGFCLSCGDYCGGVEPDARRYTCESCAAPKVFGLEQLLMMGLLSFMD